MSSPERLLINSLIEIDSFVHSQDFEKLYCGYTRGSDTWAKGFPNILRLERNLAKTAQRGYLKREQVLEVCAWDELRDQQGIECPETFTILTGTKTDVYEIIKRVKFNFIGLGPCKISKVIRFSFPTVAGIIDSTLTRVFGNGDPESQRHNWLNLYVNNNESEWFISETQSDWASEYLRWINILNFISSVLTNEGIQCPHPTSFTELDLRIKGQWTCADVEMALSSYASVLIKDS